MKMNKYSLLLLSLLLFPAPAAASDRFEAVESRHFVFRASAQTIFISTYALDCLEGAYTKIGAELEAYPKEKVLVEVYDTKEGFAAASTLGMELLEKSGTVGICKFNKLMILSPQALPVGYTWLDTLAHEYTHFLVNLKSGEKCPLWLHEGIARYHETLWKTDTPVYLSPSGETKLAQALKNDSLITFKKMHPSLVYLKTQDDISLAFAEVATAVREIKLKYGKEGLRNLLTAMAEGDSESKAFKKSLGVSPSAFEKEWEEYLRTLHLKEAVGAVSDRPSFKKLDENEYIGANQRGLIRLGDKLRELGKYDAAMFQYAKALSAEPANPFILLKISRTLISSGDLSKAEEKLNLTIAANPGYVTPYEVLGELYFKQGKFDAAASALLDAIGINPFNPATHDLLTRCYLATANTPKAELESSITASLTGQPK